MSNTKLKLLNAIQCLKDLDDYFMETLENLESYVHKQGEDEDDIKGNVARILENNGMYNFVRKDERNP